MGVEGEANGILRHPDDWYGADYGSIPIGYGVTMNATQLLYAYNALANDGAYVAPTLVAEFESAAGTVTPTERDAPRAIVSASTAGEVTRGLVEVVESGTGTLAAVDGYQVAGKTGTAWKVGGGSGGAYGADSERRYVVTFAGFLPAADPALTLVVVVDDPEGIPAGGTTAAPIFAEIAEYAMRVLEVPPTGAVVAGADSDLRVRAEPGTRPPSWRSPDECDGRCGRRRGRRTSRR